MAIDQRSWQPESPFTDLAEGERLLEPALEFGSEAEIARPAFSLRTTRPATGPARVYVKVTGQRRGDIAGDSTARGHEHWLIGTGIDYEVAVPRDAASGLPTGRRRHSPVTVTMPWSAASPVLFEVAVTNEVLTKVVFEVPAMHADGTEMITERITLTDGTVSDFRHVLDPTEGTGVDRVAFTFRRISIEDLIARTSGIDDWTAPQAEIGAAESLEAETYEIDGPGVRRSDGETFA